MDIYQRFPFIHKADINLLLDNSEKQIPVKGTDQEIDFKPAIKLFLPWTSPTWLITEIDEDGLAFGLADLGFGSPELGYISLDEIWAVKGPAGLRVEQDRHFTADKTLSEYAAEARKEGRIKA